MIYTYEMIEKLGYKSVDDFVENYINRYKNCCIRYMPNGVYLNYDFDNN